MTEFQQEIQRLYGCESTFIREKEIQFRPSGAKLLLGSRPYGRILVQEYELNDNMEGHPGVNRCYAWDQNGESIIVLGGLGENWIFGEIDRPHTAVMYHFHKNSDKGNYDLISQPD